jgi:indole-3-glycerol phosphate synthase
VSNVLLEICDTKRKHVFSAKKRTNLAAQEARAKVADAPRGFIKSLQKKRETGGYAFICEIKKASPSKGLIRPDDFNPAIFAAAYERGGASCLSVLTDEPYFQGKDAYLAEARQACTLPVLRKDFMVDPYQVVESRALGADCILIILAALDDAEAHEIEACAHEWGMDVLIEVHDGAELDRAQDMKSPLIGINNRNLKTMTVSLENTLTLAPRLPAGKIAVAESGLRTAADLSACEAVGAGCFLIGETFMRQQDVEQAVRSLQKGR